MIDTQIDRARRAYRNAFGAEPERLFAAPGRVNLIGEHTDYNDGFVLPCAIDRSTVVAAAPARDGMVEALATDVNDRDAFALAPPIARDSRRWTNYVRGVAAKLMEAGHGLSGARLAIAGDVPQGAGLSSSASVEMSVGLALASLSGVAVPPAELARIGQRAEHDYVGVACGIMDQLVSVAAEAGHALLIDCRSLDTRHVRMPADMAVLIVHSGIRHSNADSGYNDRRRECVEAAAALGVASLRDLDRQQLSEQAAALDPMLLRRARHVVTENARVIEAAEALEAGDLPRLGVLLAASHDSMRDDYEITVPPIDRLAALMNEAIGGEGGARMTGGGFGGCVIGVTRVGRIEFLRAAVISGYRTPEGEKPDMFVCLASDGAREISRSQVDAN